MQKGNSIETVKGNSGNQNHRQDNGRVYLINTGQLRVSSTKEWAKTLSQLKRQIKSGYRMTGGFQDHFC